MSTNWSNKSRCQSNVFVGVFRLVPMHILRILRIRHSRISQVISHAWRCIHNRWNCGIDVLISLQSDFLHSMLWWHNQRCDVDVRLMYLGHIRHPNFHHDGNWDTTWPYDAYRPTNIHTVWKMVAIVHWTSLERLKNWNSDRYGDLPLQSHYSAHSDPIDLVCNTPLWDHGEHDIL